MSNFEDLIKEVQSLDKTQKDLVDSINRENLVYQENVKRGDAINAQIKSDQQLLDSLEMKKSSLLEVVDELNAETVALSEGNKSLDTYKKGINAYIKKAEKQLSELSAEYNSKKSELESGFANESSAMKKSLLSVQEQINSANTDLSSIEEEIATANKTLLSLSLSIKNKESEIDSLNGQVSLIFNQIVANTESLAKSEENITVANNKLAEINADIINTKSEAQTASTELFELNKKCVEQQANLDAIVVRGASLLRRQEYLSQQEIYLEDQFKRLGLVYQPYAEN
jgi:chromosome segregation ATPase